MEKKIKKESKICPAKYINNMVYIDFDGFGISVENKLGLNSEKIKVLYQGQIGEPSFQFEIVR